MLGETVPSLSFTRILTDIHDSGHYPVIFQEIPNGTRTTQATDPRIVDSRNLGESFVRTVGVVTTSRADYGVYVPVLREIQREADLDLHLIVGGMHLVPEFGRTVDVIEADGFPIADKIDMLVSADTPEAIAESMGRGVTGFAASYSKLRPDILVVLGDRFEMHAAALAALPFKIPVAHIHGGEVTQGAIDESLRHSMTKLSHLHFVAAQEYRERVLQMGEEDWRVTVAGAPSLDNLRTLSLPAPEELEKRHGFKLDPAALLVTYHPVTLQYEQTQWQIDQLLDALAESGMPVIFPAPNADTSGLTVAAAITRFVRETDTAWFVDNLGTPDYFGLMAAAAVMVGNSSSGMVEASSFGLPVVNIGLRQGGRIRTPNIIDVGHQTLEILSGIHMATTSRFKAASGQVSSPYGDGHAAERIVKLLKTVALGDGLIIKRFCDRTVPSDSFVELPQPVDSSHK